MIILSAQHIAKSFGVNAVLRDVSLTVQQGDRIGLVGVNGCGKSTLMRILAGLDAQDGGEISLVRGLRIGYLAQQNMVTSGETVWNELQKVYEQVFAMEKKLRELEDEMAHAHTDAQRFAQLSADYDRLTQRFEEADGYSWKSMVSGVLNGLGFKPAQYDQCVDSLSGGEQTRLCLARLLLTQPELLMLESGGIYDRAEDFSLEGDDVLVLPGNLTGTYTVWYAAYPQVITGSTADSEVLDLAPEAAALLARARALCRPA